MKKILFVLILVTINSCNAIQKQDIPNFPSYKTVVESFFNHYEFDDYRRVKFEKKPEGWVLVFLDDYNKEKKSALFWSSNEDKFLELDFDSLQTGSKNEALLNQYLNKRDIYVYNVCPYYGYLGWENDVFELLDGRSELSDTLWVALARANSSYAFNLLNNSTGFSDEKIRFKFPEGSHQLNTEQVKTYRSYRHRAIDCYKKAYELNPEFETFIGNIYTKYCHEYLTSFLDLRMYKNEAEAQKELPEGLYTKFQMDWARNLLNTCAPNSILFLGGDSDTYMVLYAQAKLKYRSDVLVLNTSLLAVEAYVNHVSKPILKAAPLLLSLDKKEYQTNVNDVILIDNSKPVTINIESILEKIANTEYDEHNYLKIAGDHLNTEVNKAKYLTKYEFARKYQDSIKTEISWKANNYYLLKNDLVFLDILHTNQWKRPLYFGNNLPRESYFGLESYLQCEGLVYRLVPYSLTSDNHNIGFIESEICFNNLIKEYEYGIEKQLQFTVEKLYADNYRYTLGRLVKKLRQEGKAELALTCLKKYLKVFPNEISPHNFVSISLIEEAYELKADAEGDKVFEQILDNITQKKLPISYQSDRKATSQLLYLLDLTASKYQKNQFSGTIRALSSQYEE